MSFFKDLKTLTVESAKAIGNGVELLAEAANDLEKGTSRLLLESSIRRLEKELNQCVENDVDSLKLKSSWMELRDLYEEFWQIANQHERLSLTENRLHFTKAIANSEVGDIERQIEQQKVTISTASYSLPVDKIRALNRLNYLIGKLSALLEKQAKNSLRQSELDADSKGIERQIVTLETLRDEVFIDSYPDGSKKTRYPKRDGRLNGTVEGWHANGVQHYQLEFSQGKFNVKGKSWMPEGSLNCLIEPGENGGVLMQISLPTGEKIAAVKLKEAYVSISMWLWDGYYVGHVNGVAGNLKKWPLVISLFFKPGLWLRLIKESRQGELNNRLSEMVKAFNSWDELHARLEVCKKM